MSYFPATKETLIDNLKETIERHNITDYLKSIIYCLYNVPKNIIDNEVELRFFMKHIKFDETQINKFIQLLLKRVLNEDEVFEFINVLNIQQLLYISENVENSIGINFNNENKNEFNGKEADEDEKEKEEFIMINYINNDYYNGKLTELLKFVWNKMNYSFHNKILNYEIEYNINYNIYLYQKWISILTNENIVLVEKIKQCLMTLSFQKLIYIGI